MAFALRVARTAAAAYAPHMRTHPRLTSIPAVVVLAIGVGLLATRWPLLTHGYGSDEDAWRYVVSAWHTRTTGAYQPSRIPGFPAFELPLALLVPLGSVATNLMAALAGLVAAWLFWRIAQHLQLPRPGALALALALTPAIWVHSTQTMDYAQATALLLAGWLSMLQRRSGWAGVWFALAAASRPTLALLAPIAVLYLLLVGARWPRLARFALGFGLVFVALELPALLHPDTHGAQGQFAYHAAKQHVTLQTWVPVTRGPGWIWPVPYIKALAKSHTIARVEQWWIEPRARTRAWSKRTVDHRGRGGKVDHPVDHRGHSAAFSYGKQRGGTTRASVSARSSSGHAAARAGTAADRCQTRGVEGHLPILGSVNQSSILSYSMLRRVILLAIELGVNVGGRLGRTSSSSHGTSTTTSNRTAGEGRTRARMHGGWVRHSWISSSKQ